MIEDLGNALKNYEIDSHRIQDPKVTVKKALNNIEKAGLPVLTELKEITHLDNLGIPAFAALHNQLPHINKKPSFGKGLTKHQAMASALMERIERFSASTFDDNSFVKATYNEIKEKAISRWDLVPCNLQRILYTKKDVDNLKYNWAKCYSFSKKRCVFLPSNLVFFHQAENLNDFSDTNGLAAGNCIEEAILHGLMELIERHNQNIISYNKLSTPMINIDTIKNKIIKKLVDRIISDGFELYINDYSLGLGIPVISVLMYKKDDTVLEKAWLTHAGAHTTPETAIIRAITETAQNRAASLNESRTIKGFPKKIALSKRMEEEIDRRRKSKVIDFKKIKSVYNKNIKKEIEFCINLLTKKGFEVIAYDLTHPQLKIPVVRVILKNAQPAIYELGIDNPYFKVARVSKHLDMYNDVITKMKFLRSLRKI